MDTRSADGHNIIEGARWHYPKPGRPTECAVPGCGRVLRVGRDEDTSEAEPDDPEAA